MTSPNDAAAKVYDIVYSSYTSNAETSREIRFLSRLLNRTLPILDLGCGTGRHLIPLIERGFNVVGLDNSRGMLSVLKSKLKRKQLHSTLLCKDIRRIRLPSDKFGGVICWWNGFSEMATSSQNALRILKTLHKSMVDRGVLVIEQSNPKSFDPANLHFTSRTRHNGLTYITDFQAISFNRKLNTTISKESIHVLKQNTTVLHLGAKIKQRWWTQKEMIALLKEAGFLKVKVYGSDFRKFKESSKNIILVAIK